ncbi:MAG: hypothetical protein LBO64_02195 [Desulfovibrio sp.]|jgi:hypothetical protein|nr:hypothetical protein [Desulfovibrio sp.]
MPEFRQNSVGDLRNVTAESWRVIRIMAEMAQALDAFNDIKGNHLCSSIIL